MKPKPNHLIPARCIRAKDYRWHLVEVGDVIIAELFGAREFSVLQIEGCLTPETGTRRNLKRKLERWLGGNVKWEVRDEDA